MFPETHLLVSWVVAVKTTRNAQDCRLVTLAGLLPDADGAGLMVDLAEKALGVGRGFYFYYQEYHHFLLHGLLGAVLITAGLACFARERWRVAGLAFGMVHLHLLCDLIGSRGPTPQDLWPLYYLGPFSRTPRWVWHGQLALNAWPLRLLAIGLLCWAIALAVEHGHSVAGVFSARVDRAVIPVLRKWQAGWRKWRLGAEKH